MKDTLHKAVLNYTVSELYTYRWQEADRGPSGRAALADVSVYCSGRENRTDMGKEGKTERKPRHM